jgi:hypothetical protein
MRTRQAAEPLIEGCHELIDQSVARLHIDEAASPFEPSSAFRTNDGKLAR